MSSTAVASTIGQTGGDPGLACSPDASRVDPSYVVPAGGGSITSFAFDAIAENAGQQIDFLVLRPLGGDSYRVVGKSGTKTLTGTPGVQTFAVTPIAVAGGDLLGQHTFGTFTNCARTSGATYSFDAPVADPAVGDVVSIGQPPTCGACSLNESAQLTPGPQGSLTVLAPDGFCGTRAVKVTATLHNVDVVSHTYHLYGSWYENGVARSSFTEDVVVAPDATIERTIFNGTFLANKHGTRAIFTVVDAAVNTRQFRLEQPNTVNKCASAAPAAAASSF